MCQELQLVRIMMNDTGSTISAKGGSWLMIMEFSKKMLWLGICGLIFFSPIKNSHAETYNREYESQSGIGFYGEYIILEEPALSLEVPVMEEIKGDNPSVYEKTLNKSFPQTGVKNKDLFLPGIALMVGSCLFIKKRIKGDIG